MERHWHDSVRQVKCLLDAITVVHVNIDVNYSWVHKKQFQNGQYNIVNITKTARLWLFRMMKASTEIYGNVSLSVQ